MRTIFQANRFGILLLAVALLACPFANAEAAVKDEARFASIQIERYENLSLDLEQHLARDQYAAGSRPALQAAIRDLKRKAREGREALEAYRDVRETRPTGVVPPSAFARENLKESLLALQEAGQAAVAVFVDADNRDDPKSVAKF